MPKVTPVLLSGGTGTRLWPLSREAYPKQLLSLFGAETLLQATARRAADPTQFEPLIVVANAEHRFAVGESRHRLRLHSPWRTGARRHWVILPLCGGPS